MTRRYDRHHRYFAPAHASNIAFTVFGALPMKI
jgi:hypothetical protein